MSSLALPPLLSCVNLLRMNMLTNGYMCTSHPPREFTCKNIMKEVHSLQELCLSSIKCSILKHTHHVQGAVDKLVANREIPLALASRIISQKLIRSCMAYTTNGLCRYNNDPPRHWIIFECTVRKRDFQFRIPTPEWCE